MSYFHFIYYLIYGRNNKSLLRILQGSKGTMNQIFVQTKNGKGINDFWFLIWHGKNLEVITLF